MSQQMAPPIFTLLLGSCLILPAISTAAQPATPTQQPAGSSLLVSFSGCGDDKGQAVALLYRLGDELSIPFRSVSATIKNGQAALTFAGLGDGEYGLVVFHDQDGDDNLDTGWFHIPKEPVAFSGTYRMSFFAGPPTMSELAFSFGPHQRTQSLRLP